VLRLNPDDYQAHGSLGAVHLQLRNLELAEVHFTSALRLNPDDAVARRSLDLVLAAKRSQQRDK
jgi:Flp pilus assembly protein TadD